jgi:outer membrane protein assembly factor BamA
MSLRALVVCGLLAQTGIAAADAMTPADLARKAERGYFTGVPLAAYSVDFGFGGGARGYYYWNGTRDDDRFARTPYLHRVFLNVFLTSKGLQYHWLDYDGPTIGDSPYRIRAQLNYARNTDQSYYGFDDADREALRFPGSPMAFHDFDDYDAATKRIVDGVAYTKYDKLDAIRPSALVGIERTILPHFRVIGGLGFAYVKLTDYTGKTVDAIDAAGNETTAPQATTRFREDCDAGKLVGCAGGRDNILRLAVAYDTRDFEPDPNSGVFVDLEVDLGTTALGSEYDYVKVLAAARGWWSPFPDRADLVLAGRMLMQVQSEGTPFFTMNIMPFTEDPRFGIGGHRTMRGFRQDRFVDSVMTTASAEVRWTFARTVIKKQKLAFILVPFVDVGHSFDGLYDLSIHDWKPSYGGAFRLSWNLATLATFDYGISSESTGFYVNFGHMF